MVPERRLTPQSIALPTPWGDSQRVDSRRVARILRREPHNKNRAGGHVRTDGNEGRAIVYVSQLFQAIADPRCRARSGRKLPALRVVHRAEPVSPRRIRRRRAARYRNIWRQTTRPAARTPRPHYGRTGTADRNVKRLAPGCLRSVANGRLTAVRHAVTLILLNIRKLPAPVRISRWRVAALIWAVLLFGFLAVLTFEQQIRILLS